MGFPAGEGAAVHRTRRPWLKRASLGWVVAAVLWPLGAGASYEYFWETESSAYQALPLEGGTHTIITPSATGDGYARVALPFPVRFYENTYSDIVMTTEGMAMFGTDADLGANSNRYNPQTIPSSTIVNNLIALWWRDSTCNAGTMRRQTLGEAPNRTFILEWNGCYGINATTTPMQYQLRFFERMARIEAHYGTMAASSATTGWGATVGLENKDASNAVVPVACNKTCERAHFPTNSMISYYQRADLAVAAVSGDSPIYAGAPTTFHAKVVNSGGTPARGVQARFWLSADTVLSADDLDLGLAAETWDLLPGREEVFSLSTRTPRDLGDGYHVLVVVDPSQAVDEITRGNNTGRFGPLLIGDPTPDVTAEGVGISEVAEPGEVVAFDWIASNLGNLSVDGFEYWIVFSENDFISTTDRIVHRGVVSLDEFEETAVRTDVLIPAELRPGLYHVGLMLDPEWKVGEITKVNNIVSFPRPIHITSRQLGINTPAELVAGTGTRWSIELDAEGGDGSYEWSLESGSLPNGVKIHTERDSQGRPLYSFLGGTLSQTGKFSFSLRVQSGELFAVQAFALEIRPGGAYLIQIQTILQSASWGSPYEGRLLAVGGEAPYSWELVDGKMPTGLHFAPSGVISGTPRVDGTFDWTVRVTDAKGQAAEGDVQLVVAPPGQLTCATTRLASWRVGEAVGEVFIEAAGGVPPYTFETTESRRLARAGSDNGQSFPSAPPPGLDLDRSGKVTGAPTVAGPYVWMVKVQDKVNNTDSCSVTFEVTHEQGPAILTTSLPDAIVDTPYLAALKQFGGDEESLVWSLVPGNRLPEGLSLSPDGKISGMPSLAALEGASERIFSFAVRVRDASNVEASQPLAIRLFREPPREERKTGPRKDEEGCQAAGSGLGLLGLAYPIAALIRRRRASRHERETM